MNRQSFNKEVNELSSKNELSFPAGRIFSAMDAKQNEAIDIEEIRRAAQELELTYSAIM